jgi:hypothetical protein
MHILLLEMYFELYKFLKILLILSSCCSYNLVFKEKKNYVNLQLRRHPPKKISFMALMPSLVFSRLS